MDTLPPPAQDGNPPIKICSACGNSYPATSEFFHRHHHGTYGFASCCKACKKAGRKSPRIINKFNGVKCCNVCGNTFPDTSEFFHQKDKGRRLASQCKTCNNARTNQIRKVKREETRKANALPSGYKRCTACKEVLPATPEFFHRTKKSKDGFFERCKLCRLNDVKAYYSTHRKERQAYNTNYYATHKEESAASNAQYRKEHYDELIEKQKQYYEANRDGILRKKAIYREENQERLKLYYQTPRGIVAKRTGAHNRRALKRNAQGKHTTEELYQQLQRQKNRCYYCKKNLGKGRNNWNADHIVPLSKGGSNDISNIVIACPTCNMKKSNRMLHEWGEGGRLL